MVQSIVKSWKQLKWQQEYKSIRQLVNFTEHEFWKLTHFLILLLPLNSQFLILALRIEHLMHRSHKKLKTLFFLSLVNVHNRNFHYSSMFDHHSIPANWNLNQRQWDEILKVWVKDEDPSHGAAQEQVKCQNECQVFSWWHPYLQFELTRSNSIQDKEANSQEKTILLWLLILFHGIFCCFLKCHTLLLKFSG